MTQEAQKIVLKALIAIYLILLALCATSCINTPQKAQRKINRLVSRYPSLIHQKIDKLS
jgi:CHASE1-domain containing sensor protein